MRVALVHPHFSRSSSLERDSVLLAAGLVSLGAEVHVYCDPETRTATQDGVTFHDVRPLRIGRGPATSRYGHPLERGSFAVAATRAIRRDRNLYDVVDVRQTGAWEHDVVTVHGVVAAMQRRWPAEAGSSFRGARLRATASPVLRPQVTLDRAIQSRQLRAGAYRRVIAVTESVRDDLRDVYGVPPTLVDVVPPPVDLHRIQQARPGGVREALGLAADVPVVLFVGHGFQRKGLDRLVRAIAGIPEAHLLVIGRGDPGIVMPPDAGGELIGRVHFAGGVDDPERYYADADLLALPTRADPWGIPLIEAMAAGVPAVTSRFAGAADTLSEAGAGVVLRDESVEALREAIGSLIRDPARRRELGRVGPAAAERFRPEAHAAAVARTYRTALTDADPRRDGLLVS
jgi:UDP-glucose:(heptosyl)LPS alpha-1,3-glucosyltransferase